MPRPSGVTAGVPPDPDQPPLCKVCKMPAVAGCRNTLKYPSGGSILMHRGERLVSVDCPNMRIVSLRRRLTEIDPQFLRVPHFAKTPLYQAGEIDRTEDNLFLRHAHWRTFLAHFKWVIASKKTGFFVRVVTDMTLLNVFLGNASVKNRLQSQRTDEGELLISNSIEDLLSSPDLAVIRLGHVVHANRAAANVLREALSLRLGLGKATWLVEPPEQTFSPHAMPCCDENSLQLVQSTFEEMHLKDAEEVRPAYVEDEDGVTVPGVGDALADNEDEEEPEPEKEPAEDENEPPEPRGRDSDAELLRKLTDRSPSKKWQRRPQPKKRR